MIFSDCHPIVNFIFYAGAIGLGMCFSHPLFLSVSSLLSISFYWILMRNMGKYLLRMAVVFATISLINPVFSIYGETVLFTYFQNRAYTFEALCYGCSIFSDFVPSSTDIPTHFLAPAICCVFLIKLGTRRRTMVKIIDIDGASPPKQYRNLSLVITSL